MKQTARVVLLLIAVAFYFFHLTAQDLSAMNTPLETKKVKEKKVYTYFENNNTGKIILDSMLLFTYSFDPNGRLLENITYDNTGSVASKQEFVYNNAGKKIRAKIYNGQGNLLNSMGYKYDKYGNLVSEILYEKGDEIEHEKNYTYNAAGKKTMELEKRDEHRIYKKALFLYDERRNLVEDKHFDGNDSLLFRYEYKYDLRNNKIEEVRYDGKRQEWRFEYTYTDFNKIEKQKLIYPYETSNSSIVYKYNQDQNLVDETTYDYNNTVIQKNSYTYENGKLIEERKGNLITAYKFNSDGNKILEKEINDGALLREKHFDKNGNIILLMQYLPNKAMDFEEHYTYDALVPKRLINTSRLDGKKNILDQTECKYDQFGNLIEEIKKNNASQLLSKNKIIYKYYE